MAVGANGSPLRPAMMYNDGRAQVEAGQIRETGHQQATALGHRFNPSLALSKILWLRRHAPRHSQKLTVSFTPSISSSAIYRS